MITNELINEIRGKLNIVDVISRYVPLTQKGKNYFGVCPFHDDHSPSMSVSSDKQIYTCFSCGATGNVFTFVSEFEHLSFYDTVKILGNSLGYKFDDTRQQDSQKNNFLEIYELSYKFYQNNLNSSIGQNAIEYLNNRKIDLNTIKKFKIGLSTSKQSLTNFLLEKKFSLKDLVALGISNENGMDLFSNRIMFPLFDLGGNVVGFSGRIYNTKDSSKYINTRETELFKKGKLLYNFHNAKETLKKSESIIVMEGFMDVIRSSVVNINNCVATMGTAFTKQHAILLNRISNNIILCFDGDSAGEEATISAINVLKEINVYPKIIRLPDDLDPDEFILKYGAEEFNLQIQNAENSIDYLMRYYKKNTDVTDISQISEYINKTIIDLSKTDDNVIVELTLKKISTEFNLEYKTLIDKFNLYKINNEIKSGLKNNHKKNTNIINNVADTASFYLIYYMIRDNKIIEKVSSNIKFFPNTLIRRLVNEIIFFYHKYGIFNIADFISYVNNEKELLELINNINTYGFKDTYCDEEINDYILTINNYAIKIKIEEIENKIKNEKDPLIKASLLSEMMTLKGVK